MIRFRHFGTRLLCFMVGLLAVAQLATLFFIAQASRRDALAAIEADLAQGARQFNAIVRDREAALLTAARLMTGDYALLQLFRTPEFSAATARSALLSYRDRIQAPELVLLDADGALLADVRASVAPRPLAPFLALRTAAEAVEELEATGWAALDDNTLHQLVMVPLFGPGREIIAWVGIGFPTDRATAEALKTTSNLEVTFFTGEAVAPRIIASTLDRERATDLARAAFAPPDVARRTRDGERYVTSQRRLRTADGSTAWAVLQRSLDAELVPALALQKRLIVISLAGLAAASLVALLLARSFSGPVRALAAHTRLIAGGDYATRLDLRRRDELGDLATAFNAMSTGLDERDRVRDLLDKNVSPEVATRLLRDGAALGGEEREVTILFADLRGFTTLSEGLPPRDLIALLNRFLDRMSARIEAEGGIIDKFIGDEIMALFGAPVAQPDSADRAVRAALGMRAALAELNAELAAEGRPPLAFGVGINTAHVVAGNIGSHRRLNYSVIGDGVNLAARLQPLTRRAEFATDILISGDTRAALRGTYALRALGETSVKGRAAAVTLHAVDGTA
jgi:adenylate cyclase